MTLENPVQDQDQKSVVIHIDYFCPFCGMKLFRGRVATLKMVCSGCNKLVQIKDGDNQYAPSEERAIDY